MLRLPTIWLLLVAMVSLTFPGAAGAQAPAATPTPEVMARLKTRAEVFLFALMSGDPGPVAGQMAPGVRNAWRAETCKNVFGDLMQRGGLLQGTDPATLATHPNGHVIATVPVNYARNTVAAQVVFERAAPLAKVVGFSIQPYTRPEATARVEGGSAPAATPATTVPMPPYAQRELFVERRVEVPATAELKLHGIVTLPTIAGATSTVPGVILIPGNGDFDEDATMGGNKPMRDIAHGLATLGVASIRFARRSYADPAGMTATPAPDLAARFTADAIQAARVLANQKEVDGKRLIVVGHDIGALVAPMVAREINAQAVVLMAPLPSPTLPYLASQATHLIEAGPAPSEAGKAALEAAASALARQAVGKLEPGEMLAGLPASVWLQLDSADPARVLGEDRRPFAVLWPGASFLLMREEDRAGWAAVVEKASPLGLGRTVAGVNHWFIPVEGEPTFESTLAAGNVSEALVRDLASYVTLGQLTPQ